MPISLALLAAAVLAVATPTTTAPPVRGPAAITPTLQPAWRAVHADTLGDLLFTTETLNGRVRFVARGLKGSVPVTTADFPPDSVRAWATSAAELVAMPSPKMGEMRGLGQALTLNVTTATTGEAAFGFYVGDAVSDQQLALALTKPNAAKLASGVNNALDAISH
jgi:hypothetical protein